MRDTLWQTVILYAKVSWKSRIKIFLFVAPFSRKSNLEAFQIRANLVDFRLDRESICKNIISILHTKTKEKFRTKFCLESHFPENQNREFMKSMCIELILY